MTSKRGDEYSPGRQNPGSCYVEISIFPLAMQEILKKSPISIKMLKFAMNLTDDGMVGQQVFAGEATRLAYMTDEAKEGRDAFLEKRPPNFEKKWLP